MWRIQQLFALQLLAKAWSNFRKAPMFTELNMLALRELWAACNANDTNTLNQNTMKPSKKSSTAHAKWMQHQARSKDTLLRRKCRSLESRAHVRRWNVEKTVKDRSHAKLKANSDPHLVLCIPKAENRKAKVVWSSWDIFTEALYRTKETIPFPGIRA